MIDFPVNTVRTETGVKHRASGFVIAPENTRDPILKSNYRAIENAVRARNSVSLNNRILAIPPDNIFAFGRTFFPWNFCLY
jgi:hypothetical protein